MLHNGGAGNGSPPNGNGHGGPNSSTGIYDVSPATANGNGVRDSSASSPNEHAEQVDEKFLAPAVQPVLRLRCAKAFEQLTNREKLYAHHFSRACWYGSLVILEQVSPESRAIFEMLILCLSDDTPGLVRKYYLEKEDKELGKKTDEDGSPKNANGGPSSVAGTSPPKRSVYRAVQDIEASNASSIGTAAITPATAPTVVHYTPEKMNLQQESGGSKRMRQPFPDPLRKTDTDATSVGNTEFRLYHFYAYACCFFGNMGNYMGFGDTKFIPRISPKKFEDCLEDHLYFLPLWKQNRVRKLWGGAAGGYTAYETYGARTGYKDAIYNVSQKTSLGKPGPASVGGEGGMSMYYRGEKNKTIDENVVVSSTDIKVVQAYCAQHDPPLELWNSRLNKHKGSAANGSEDILEIKYAAYFKRIGASNEVFTTKVVQDLTELKDADEEIMCEPIDKSGVAAVSYYNNNYTFTTCYGRVFILKYEITSGSTPRL